MPNAAVRASRGVRSGAAVADFGVRGGRVSASSRRRSRPNGTITAPSRNAIRQPQASIPASLSRLDSAYPTRPETRMEPSWLMYWKET